MDDVFNALADIKRTGTSGALCTIIKTKGSTPRKEGSKMLVFENGSIVGTVGGGEVEARVIQEALNSIKTGKSRIISYDLIDPDQGDPGICGGSLEIFVDPIDKPEELVVIGGGHVGKAVVFLAKWLGFRVILNDDRKEFCSPDLVPGADEYFHCPLAELPEKYQIPASAAVVLATRNQKVDINGLPKLLAIPTAYIGVISSKRRWKLTKEQLIESGVNKDNLKKIHAPIGLKIGAETPEEIALSILAEIISNKRVT
ncbi:MAG: XdhC family protein [Anaerolineales bacterium]